MRGGNADVVVQYTMSPSTCGIILAVQTLSWR
jgi:hypothetical protein